LKQKSKKRYKPSSKSHIAKTRKEKEEYDEKLKLADSEGATEEQVQSKTSTLSDKSIYATSESTGILDRDRIKPPKVSEGFAKWIGIAVGILTIVGLIIAACIWLTTLRNQVDFNEKKIGQLSNDLNEVDAKRENLSIRITRLEQWKDIVGEDLNVIKADMRNAVSNEQIEVKLVELEKRVLSKVEKNNNSE
jgi:hypothetical protein